MTANGIFQITIFFVALLLIVKPLGLYIFHVYEGTSALNRVFGPLERFVYRLMGVQADTEMNWKNYALAAMLFSLLGVLLLYALQRLQMLLPLNPQSFGAVSPDRHQGH